MRGQATVILLLALSTSVVGAGPEWRQRNDGLQAAERTLAHARRLAPEQPTRALALLRQGLAAHPRHAGLRLAAARLERHLDRPGDARRLLVEGAHLPMEPAMARRQARELLRLAAPLAARRLLQFQRRRLRAWPAAAVAALQRSGREVLARRALEDRIQRQRLTDDLRRLPLPATSEPETP